jgi:hypothetical protein
LSRRTRTVAVTQEAIRCLWRLFRTLQIEFGRRSTCAIGSALKQSLAWQAWPSNKQEALIYKNN